MLYRHLSGHHLSQIGLLEERLESAGPATGAIWPIDLAPHLHLNLLDGLHHWGTHPSWQLGALLSITRPKFPQGFYTVTCYLCSEDC